MRQHELALERFVRSVESDPTVVGVVLTGSVARGRERADSDVDVYLVVTDERWDDAVAHDRVMYVDRVDEDYPHGYLDVKLVTPGILAAAPERADDPFRASLEGARVALDRGGVADLIAAARMPDERWADRIRSFASQVRLHAGYFLAGAERDGDPLLARSASTHALLAAHRALLARARILYRGPKYLRADVGALPDRPADWDDIVAELLAAPTASGGQRLIDALDAHLDIPLDDAGALSTFVIDNEYAWWRREPAPEYS